MSLMHSRDRLLESILGLLWAQWTELGVAGVAGTDASVIDPEVLVLATSRFGRYEPRLFDEVLDWLARFSGLLDVTRLRRLAAQSSAADPRVVTALVDFMRQQSAEGKWEVSARTMIAREDGERYGRRVPLFLNANGSGIPVFGQTDPFFLGHGFERPVLELRGMAAEPVLRKPALARLRLRALMGAGVRAEVLLYLGTHDRAHGRLISARAGFAQRQVSEYLAQLADAGFVERWEDGRTVQYRLNDGLAAAAAPIADYTDWQSVWSAIATLWEGCEASETATSAYAASKTWRTTLESVKTYLPAEGFGARTPTPEHHGGEAVLAYAADYVEQVSSALDAASRATQESVRCQEGAEGSMGRRVTMDVVDAIREAVPLARIRGSQVLSTDAGARVEVRELAQAGGFVIVVQGPDGVPRPATRHEVESAGFPYDGEVRTGTEGQESGAWTSWW